MVTIKTFPELYDVVRLADGQLVEVCAVTPSKREFKVRAVDLEDGRPVDPATNSIDGPDTILKLRRGCRDVSR